MRRSVAMGANLRQLALCALALLLVHGAAGAWLIALSHNCVRSAVRRLGLWAACQPTCCAAAPSTPPCPSSCVASFPFPLQHGA